LRTRSDFLSLFILLFILIKHAPKNPPAIPKTIDPTKLSNVTGFYVAPSLIISELET